MDPEQRDRLLASLASYSPTKEGWFAGLSAEHTVRFLLYTGAHPRVLAKPEAHRLRLVRHREGMYVAWDRPKTGAAVEVPVHKSLETWVEEFVRELPSRTISVRHYESFLADIGARAGIPDLTPMSLRHSFMRWVADQSHDASQVQKLGRCSPAIALRYAEAADRSRDAVLREA